MFAAISLIAFKRPISPKLQHAISCGFIHWWVSSDFCTTSKSELGTVDILDNKTYKARCLVLANTHGQKAYQ